MMTLAIAAGVKVGLMIAGGAVVAGGCGFGGYKIGKKIDEKKANKAAAPVNETASAEAEAPKES